MCGTSRQTHGTRRTAKEQIINARPERCVAGILAPAAAGMGGLLAKKSIYAPLFPVAQRQRILVPFPRNSNKKAIDGDLRLRVRRSGSHFACQLIGFDTVGKTTTMVRLKLGEVKSVMPTIGYHVEQVPLWASSRALSTKPLTLCSFSTRTLISRFGTSEGAHRSGSFDVFTMQRASLTRYKGLMAALLQGRECGDVYGGLGEPGADSRGERRAC